MSSRDVSDLPVQLFVINFVQVETFPRLQSDGLKIAIWQSAVDTGSMLNPVISGTFYKSMEINTVKYIQLAKIDIGMTIILQTSFRKRSNFSLL